MPLIEKPGTYRVDLYSMASIRENGVFDPPYPDHSSMVVVELDQSTAFKVTKIFEQSRCPSSTTLSATEQTEMIINSNEVLRDYPQTIGASDLGFLLLTFLPSTRKSTTGNKELVAQVDLGALFGSALIVQMPSTPRFELLNELVFLNIPQSASPAPWPEQ
ncbi:hypothetical protein ABW19_dt0201427 [Dactylella cylindrospora]|nr:hypothetical protein ABW19_dt0201427 [Dactylella cylindrospora]